MVGGGSLSPFASLHKGASITGSHCAQRKGVGLEDRDDGNLGIQWRPARWKRLRQEGGGGCEDFWKRRVLEAWQGIFGSNRLDRQEGEEQAKVTLSREDLGRSSG